MQRALHRSHLDLIDSALENDLEMFHSISSEDAIHALKFILNTQMLGSTKTRYEKLPQEFCTDKFLKVAASLEQLYRTMQNRWPQKKVRGGREYGPEFYYGIFNLEAWVVEDYPIDAELVRDYLKRKFNLTILLLTYLNSVIEPYFQREDKKHEKNLLVEWVTENEIEMPELVQAIISKFDIKTFIQNTDPSLIALAGDLLKIILELSSPHFLCHDIEIVKTIYEINPMKGQNEDAELQRNTLNYMKEKVRSFAQTNIVNLCQSFIIAEKAYRILCENRTLLIHRFEVSKLVSLENEVRDFLFNIKTRDSIGDKVESDLGLFIDEANQYFEEANVSLVKRIFSEYFSTNVEEEKAILYKSLVELHCVHNKVVISDDWLEKLKNNPEEKRSFREASKIPVLQYYHLNRVVLHACFIPKDEWSVLFYEFFSSCIRILNSNSEYNELDPQFQKTSYPSDFIKQLVSMEQNNTESKNENPEIFPLFYSYAALKYKINYLSSSELDTVLAACSAEQKSELRDYLLSQDERIKVDVLDRIMYSSLHHSIFSLTKTLTSHYEVIEYFFDKKYLFRYYRYEELANFLLHLVLHNERELAKKLVVIAPLMNLSVSFDNGYTASHICMTREIDDVEFILKFYANNVIQKVDGRTPLMLGIACKNAVLLSKLCFENRFLLWHSDKELAPIIPILINSHVEAAKHLFERSYSIVLYLSDADQVNFFKKIGYSANVFLSAILMKHFAFVSFLIDYPQNLTFYTNAQLGEALYYLIDQDQFYLANELIKIFPNININWQEEKSGSTPLHLCMAKNSKDHHQLPLILKLHECDLDVEKKDRNGNTPLMLLIKYKKFKQLNQLCGSRKFRLCYSSFMLYQILTTLLSAPDYHKLKSINIFAHYYDVQLYLFDADFWKLERLLKSKLICYYNPSNPEKINKVVFWWLSQKTPMHQRYELRELLPPTNSLSAKKMRNNTTAFREAVLNDHMNAVEYFIQNNMLNEYSTQELEEAFLYLVHKCRSDLAIQLMDFRPEMNLECLVYVPDDLLSTLHSVLRNRNLSHGNELLVLTAVKMMKLDFLKNICQILPCFISSHPIPSLLTIYKLLKTNNKHSLCEMLCNNNLRLREIVATSALFKLPELEESPIIPLEHINNALNRLSPENISTLYLMIFLKTLLISVNSNLRLFERPPFYSTVFTFLSKLIADQENHTYKIDPDEARSIYELTYLKNSLIAKIINKFINCEVLTPVKNLKLQESRFDCVCSIS